jgi:DNA-binding SARP family transcriptional activator
VGQSSHDFQVLGDLSVTINGEHRPVTAGKQRAALAMLLLSANRTVSSVSLLEGIWGTELPQHPDTALQIVISRLRGSLGPAAHRLVSRPSGYRIDVAADELDLSIAQSAFANGQRLRTGNDSSRAADVLDDALSRWTSEPLLDLVAFPFCAAARNRLRELRVAIYELRNEALLEAGRHLELLETIEEWTSSEPWRERLRFQHVLALYRGGRQVDALRAYDAYRGRLVEELGVEPSDELRELHRDVLCHAPRLAIGVGPLGSRIPLWTSLSLPFVGRGDEEEQIFGRIHEVFAGSRMMVLVEGEAGIGKTRLILEIARRVQGDSIVLSATANDSMRPAVVGLAHALVDAVLHLPDDELRRCLGRGPGDLAAFVPSLRDRLPDLVPAFHGDAATRGQRLVSSVASCVTALSRRAPIVLLFDDLHRSGASLLLLLGRLMVVDEQQRILVLATARLRSPNGSSNLADLAEQLERHGRLDRVRLDGLRASSVERLLRRLGTREPTDEAQLLHRVTNGHPFFLAEILQTDDWQRALVDSPASVREFVRRRVHTLGDAEEGILVDAAGLGIAFDATLLAEITGVPQATTAALIDRAATAGVLRTVDKGTFTFVHELCRRALLDNLDDECRARLHHRIATSLDGRDLPPAVLAMHWRWAPGREAAERTHRYARLAGDAAMLDLDPALAATWYEIALATTEDPETRRRLLIGVADARDQTERQDVSRRLDV